MKERRRFPRYRCLLGMRYRSSDGKESGSCFTKDVSAGGLCIPLLKPLNTHKPLIIDIDMPENGGKLTFTSSVRWCRRSTHHWESPYSAGIQFENADPFILERVISFARTHPWAKNDFERALEHRTARVFSFKRLIFDWLYRLEWM